MGCKASTEGVEDVSIYDTDAKTNADPINLEIDNFQGSLRKLIVPSQCFIWKGRADLPTDDEHDALLEELRLWYSGHHPTLLHPDHYGAYHAAHFNKKNNAQDGDEGDETDDDAAGDADAAAANEDPKCLSQASTTSLSSFASMQSGSKGSSAGAGGAAAAPAFARMRSASITSLASFRQPSMRTSKHIKEGLHGMLSTTVEGVKKQIRRIGRIAYCGVKITDIRRPNLPADPQEPVDLDKRLCIKLTVELHFPSSSDWLGAGTKLLQTASARSKDKQKHEARHAKHSQKHTSASAVDKKIRARIEGFVQQRDDDEDSCDSDHKPVYSDCCVRIKLTKLEVPRTTKQGGDPMADDWLPKSNILTGLQHFLNRRLANVLNGDLKV